MLWETRGAARPRATFSRNREFGREERRNMPHPRFPSEEIVRREEEIEAAIDTGFNRYLTLPPAVIARLGLPFEVSTRVMLADGRVVPMDYYRVTVVWDGRDRDILVLAAESAPLVGMSLLYGYDL